MCHPPVWAGLILYWSGTELPPTLSDTSQALTFPPTSPYPILAFLGVRCLRSILRRCKAQASEMAHDYLFMPLLPLLEGLGTFSWAWIPRASLLVVILHRAWELEVASEVLLVTLIMLPLLLAGTFNSCQAGISLDPSND